MESLQQPFDDQVLRRQIEGALNNTIGRVALGRITKPHLIPKPAGHATGAASLSRARHTAILDETLAAAERLQAEPWTDAAIAKLPDEALATMAFNMSKPLRREFTSLAQFLAYRRGLIGKLGR